MYTMFSLCSSINAPKSPLFLAWLLALEMKCTRLVVFMRWCICNLRHYIVICISAWFQVLIWMKFRNTCNVSSSLFFFLLLKSSLLVPVQFQSYNAWKARTTQISRRSVVQECGWSRILCIAILNESMHKISIYFFTWKKVISFLTGSHVK